MLAPVKAIVEFSSKDERLPLNVIWPEFSCKKFVLVSAEIILSMPNHVFCVLKCAYLEEYIVCVCTDWSKMFIV